jgi:hypothetical protein
MFAAFRAALAVALVAGLAWAAGPAGAQLGTTPPPKQAKTAAPQQKMVLKPLGSVRHQAKPKRSVVVGSGATRHEMNVQ